MNSTVRSCLHGAGMSRGVVVVIDIFRSSNTILMLLSKGALSVIPVSTVKDAFALKKSHPSFILAGERKGKTIDGFDMGNSPYEVAKADVEGNHVILTTSAGTQGMVQARNAERMLIGSFGNAHALVNWIRNCDPPLVTWLAVGTEGIRTAVEDDLCAIYLQNKLKGNSVSLWPLLYDIMEGEGANRLKGLGQENDLPYCLCKDLFEIVPEVIREENSLQIKIADDGGHMDKSRHTRTDEEIEQINRIQSDFFSGLIEVFNPPLPDGVPEKLEKIVASAGISKGDVVLDVGAGTGVLVPLIQSYRPRKIVACDLSAEMLNHLKERYPFVDTVQKDIRNLRESDETIDIVFINACYPNIVDKERSVANIARMMKPGGRLVISHPMGKSFIAKLRERSPFPLDDFPEKKEAGAFLNLFGLEVVHFEDRPDLYLLVAGKGVVGQ